jgi:hypothetical protein
VSAANYNFSIACGEDFSFTLRVLDAFEDPVNFSGSTYIAEIREEHKKPLVAAFTVTSEGDGTLKFVLTNDQTKLLSPTRQYKWDFFWTASDNNVTKLLYGTVNAVSNISNV